VGGGGEARQGRGAGQCGTSVCVGSGFDLGLAASDLHRPVVVLQAHCGDLRKGADGGWGWGEGRGGAQANAACECVVCTLGFGIAADDLHGPVAVIQATAAIWGRGGVRGKLGKLQRV
jgi:hypothetical protein